MAKTGRRSRLTPEIQERVVDAIQAGNYLETAAAYAGIADSTMYNWLDRGRKERDRAQSDDTQIKATEQPFVDFLEAVEKARATAEVRAVALIQKAASDTWQAAAWYLERSAPKKWGRRERLEHTGPEGSAVQVSVSMDDLEAKLTKVLETRRGNTAS